MSICNRNTVKEAYSKQSFVFFFLICFGGSQILNLFRVRLRSPLTKHGTRRGSNASNKTMGSHFFNILLEGLNK
jgi:hypothetical protein